MTNASMTAKSLLVQEYSNIQEHIQPSDLGGDFWTLYNAVTSAPQIASVIAFSIHQNKDVLGSVVDNLSRITYDQWSTLITTAWNENPKATSVAEVTNDMEQTRKVLETIAVSVGLVAAAIDAIASVLLAILGIIAVVSGGTMAIPAAIAAAVVVLIAVFSTATLLGLSGVLSLIAIWI